jgi:tight adherence protein C
MELIFATSVLFGLSVLFIVLGITQAQRHRSVRERLNVYLEPNQPELISLQQYELAPPFTQRVVLPALRQVAPLFTWMLPQNRVERLKRRLILAGNPSGMTTLEFVVVKGITFVLFATLAMLFVLLNTMALNIQSITLAVVFSACGFFLPDVWLLRRVRQRQTDITHAMPDALDMLTITIEAGLSFENGLHEISQKWNNQLSREFQRVIRDIGTGLRRRQALLDMAERTGVADVQNFVNALAQAEELGVSIARVLQVQAEEMRIKRRQRAQERANQAPIKMMFPLVFLIFPAIFAVLLGPAIAQLLDLM